MIKNHDDLIFQEMPGRESEEIKGRIGEVGMR